MRDKKSYFNDSKHWSRFYFIFMSKQSCFSRISLWSNSSRGSPSHLPTNLRNCVSDFPHKKRNPQCGFLFLLLLSLFFQCCCFICTFPRKINVCTAEMSVCCCLLVNWAAQVKHFDNTSRTKVEVSTN